MKAAVLGSPIAHSLSPALHGAAYRALGLTDWSYTAIECDERGLSALVARCGPEWAGLSLTMPLKRAVLPLLDEADPLVGAVGAANTVVFAAGRRHGHNTDVPGMMAALAEAGLSEVTEGAGTGAGRRGAQADGPDAGQVLIVGGGATARSALAVARGLGAHAATVAVRDPSRVGDLLATARRLRVTVRLTAFDEPGAVSPALLISTVPAGAADEYARRVARGALTPACVLDVVYHPWPTPLATAVQQTGARVAGGFAMLLHQAAEQVRLMTGQPAPVEDMRAAGAAALGAAEAQSR